jgi:FixJ family two-component response regulator
MVVILMVEDDVVIRDDAEIMVQDRGYDKALFVEGAHLLQKPYPQHQLRAQLKYCSLNFQSTQSIC